MNGCDFKSIKLEDIPESMRNIVARLSVGGESTRNCASWRVSSILCGCCRIVDCCYFLPSLRRLIFLKVFFLIFFFLLLFFVFSFSVARWDGHCHIIHCDVLLHHVGCAQGL